MAPPPILPPKPKVQRGGVIFVSHGNHWTRWLDVYHELLKRPWSFTLTVLFVGWVATNALFAALYLIGGDCISAPDPTSFFQAFTFSVQTISSIGYGAMHPTTDWARVLANLEAFVGMVMMAMGTGLMFAKFSRPTARIEFSDYALIQLRGGVPHLVLRVANQRGNRIVGARMHVAVFVDEVTVEGHAMRKLIDLPLVRDHTPTFALSMTLMHRIDDRSPFHGLGPDQLADFIVSMVVTIHGLDETFNQTVHAQYYYGSEHIVWNQRFVDMVTTREGGAVEVNHYLLSETEPMPADQHIPVQRAP
jgi:inward rectifier potassium channel